MTDGVFLLLIHYGDVFFCLDPQSTNTLIHEQRVQGARVPFPKSVFPITRSVLRTAENQLAPYEYLQEFVVGRGSGSGDWGERGRVGWKVEE